jgi:hexulose-6-phosphate isomerase
MQGRLVPPKDGRIQCFPRDNWQDEFQRAFEVGFDTIEWLYDLHDADVNPLATDEGIKDIQMVSRHYGIKIISVCAHCFIEEPLMGIKKQDLEKRLERCAWLLGRLRQLGAQRLVLPFENSTSIATANKLEKAVLVVKRILRFAEENEVEIDIEASCPPKVFAVLLDRIKHPLIKVNYDAGNSACLGYSIHEEFAAYGHRIGSVHIKDKVRGGGTVALGAGDVNFDEFACHLRAISYSGAFILEVARGGAGEELDWAKKNLAFVREKIIDNL